MSSSCKTRLHVYNNSDVYDIPISHVSSSLNSKITYVVFSLSAAAATILPFPMPATQKRSVVRVF